MKKSMIKGAAATVFALALAAQPADSRAAAHGAETGDSVLSTITAVFQRVAMSHAGPRTCFDLAGGRIVQCPEGAVFAGLRASVGVGYAWGDADASASASALNTPEIYERVRASAADPWGAYKSFYSAASTKAVLEDPAYRSSASSSGDVDLSGAIGEFALGYDEEFGDWVVGGSVSLGLTNVDGSTASLEIDSDWTAAFLARVGYKIDAQTMLFATAGLALQDFEAVLSDASGRRIASESSTEIGFVIGAGVERVLTKNIFVALDYRYVDFGEITLAGSSSDFIDGKTYDYGARQRGSLTQSSYSASVEPTLHALRAHIGYRF